MKTKQAISNEINLPVREVEVNGTNLSYIEKGTGLPVVFIHGAVSDFRIWNGQIDAFSERFRAISYSRRSHSPNETCPEVSDYSRVSHTDDLIAFLKALKLEKATLVGHSYGGAIALMTALQHPELVGSLVLAEASPFPALLGEQGRVLFAEQQAGFDEALKAAKNGNKEPAVRKFLKTITGIDVLSLLPDDRRAVVLENADTLEPMLENYYQSFLLGGGQLKRVTMPALLITGELSPRISRLSDEALDRFLPNSRLEVLKGASHGLQIENPRGFNRLVIDFLTENQNNN